MTSSEFVNRVKDIKKSYNLKSPIVYKIPEIVPFEIKFTLSGFGMSVNAELENIVDFCRANNLGIETKVFKNFVISCEVRVIISGRGTKQKAQSIYNQFAKFC